MRQKHRFHGLKRIGPKIKVRQTWNKYNLYNLSRLKEQDTRSRTYYQQKWSAKSTTRAYHGEYIREKQWQKMFRPFAPAVVPLDPSELALSDGSEQAEGRGSGKEQSVKQRGQKPIPYMSMVYGPIERRLDTAIFRALFASSARQARQFVVHGAVTVNGKKMIYPGYLLNPGDMFQVDPDRVMYATGVQKELVRQRTRRAYKAEKQRLVEEQRAEALEEAEVVAEAAATETQTEEFQQPEREESEPEQPTDKELKKELNKKRKAAVDQVRTLLEYGKTTLSANRKKELRALIPQILEICNETPPNEVSTLDEKLAPILSIINPSSGSKKSSKANSKDQDQETNTTTQNQRRENDNYQTAAERQEIAAILARVAELRENPIDHHKPYATPWQPRPWMSPFAFIPRYLEVNQNVCAAVYLRHPVARPGLAEVPSPFHYETSQLAFNWYLRRR